ncbi:MULTISPECIES: YebC/PmpR family DNA-binding transcriptional regulator [unclassified Sporosarcina]|uniref:YebC/PmpR family DNA-binding transcriptional regulator n=1 Tax=unclassified Sporosarcina TaxID=2647733 RepID=UPI000C1636F0|nr:MULTISPECIES: YebC/PmpR family DNA-binding transcriptional regulator [unclassified Sporosarcina]PID07363.1 YebC/PmpR family DNA-binding transcriptional regulator [Sporosarcina sp. P30]PID10559.1 YebC/PmpR family DNA-binding transcriptional regulator [Sporosarcina sp. P31]PID13144.1 YebC/PmpR family DNA-binding transcriptional regulator [Sporosarcina sp. P32b]
MAGHSKWKNIQNRKGAQDAKRGKIFQKMSREIYVAAKSGGDDPDTNPALRLAIDKSKSVNVPNDVIQRAIDKATGSGADENYEEVIYEGYGPGGVAVLVYTLTENRNRTAPNMRVAFNKNGGSLGETGSVNYLFERKGRLFIERTQETDEDAVMLAALEAGAEDVISTEDGFEILTEPSEFLNVKEALEAEDLVFISAEVDMVPSVYADLTEEQQEQFMNMIDALEDDDDVQNVYSNASDE